MKKKSVNPAMAMMAARAMRTPSVRPSPMGMPQVAPNAMATPPGMPAMPGMKKGGQLKPVDASKNPGMSKLPTEVRNKMGYMKKGGMGKKCMKEGGMADMAQDKAMIKKAFKQHDMQEHKGDKGTKLALKKGGMSKGCGYAAGGKASQLSKANGIAVRGKTKGKMC